jgi:hypothetical protein
MALVSLPDTLQAVRHNSSSNFQQRPRDASNDSYSLVRQGCPLPLKYPIIPYSARRRAADNQVSSDTHMSSFLTERLIFMSSHVLCPTAMPWCYANVTVLLSHDKPSDRRAYVNSDIQVALEFNGIQSGFLSMRLRHACNGVSLTKNHISNTP